MNNSDVDWTFLQEATALLSLPMFLAVLMIWLTIW
jgi:hypothetical protein